MSKKRVLFTLVNLNIGGVQKTLINILNAIDYSKYEVDVMLLEDKKELIDFVPKNVKILKLTDYVNLKLGKKSLLYRIYKNINVFGIIKKFKGKFNLEYDISVAFNGFNNYIDLAAVSVKSRKKIIWIHNDFYNVVKYSKFKTLYSIMYKLMGRKFGYFDKAVCVSNMVKENINKLYNNKYSDKFVVINNYIDSDDVLKGSCEDTNVKFEDNFNIVSTGRICKAKNYELLLKLHKKLIDNNYNIKTYVVGDGESRANLEKLISNNNLGKTFIILGSKKNPYPIMKKADLYVSTSLYESFGNTILESLILGVPVVSTSTSGSVDISNNIADEGTCLIGNTPNELYNLIIKVIKDNKKIKPLDLNDYNKKVMNSIYELLS